MDEKKNRVKDIMPHIILIIVLVCAALIVMDVTTTLTAEMETRNNQTTIQSTLEPTRSARPTYPPDHTPSPVNEGGH